MNKPTHVEVRTCVQEVNGQVRWVSEFSAEFFGVYDGEPGDFTWVADFAEKGDALRWAKDRAMRFGAELVNRIGEE